MACNLLMKQRVPDGDAMPPQEAAMTVIALFGKLLHAVLAAASRGAGPGVPQAIPVRVRARSRRRQ